MPPQYSETRSSKSKRKGCGSASQNQETKKGPGEVSDDITMTANETATAIGDIDTIVTPHILCAMCKATISKSHLLNNRIHEIKITLDPQGCTERWEQLAHHPSLEALKASARAGCHLCTLLCTIVNDKSVDQVIEDEQKEAEDDCPDPMEGYGGSFLSALNIAPQIRRERNERQRRRMQQLGQIEDSQSPNIPGILLQLSWSCSKWEERIEAKWGSFVSINLELNWCMNYPMEINGRKALRVHPTEYVQSQGQQWEANRDDPIEAVHDAQISISTESAASFDLAREWLARCKKEHPTCRKAVQSASKFPKRLLDLGSGEDQTIRLRVGLGRKEFVALSHRWGNSQPLRLLKDNIQTFETEINPDHLPRTFRDAVTITRKLGYRYLWIDSLCIVQDCKDDWMAESAIMGQIYRCSALNISTGGADDSNSGCFATREPLRQRACILTGDATTGFCIPTRCPSEWRDHDGSSTISRGWIFQERMLAPRTLHYSRKTISWECICLDATEGRPKGDTWDWEKDRRYRRPKEMFQTLCDFQRPAKNEALGFVNKNVETFYQAWSELVNSYSNKALTERSDKLVALHGIMSMIAESTGLRNVAGLWVDFLSFELMWSTWNPAEKRPEFYDGAKYRAPSWSWACVDSGVRLEYPDLHRGRNENILGISMWISYSLTRQFRVPNALVSVLANGQVKDGHLVVEGRVRKMEWKENSGVKGFKYNKQARSISDVWSPDFLRATSFENWGLLLMTGTGSPHVQDARIDIILALDRVKADKEWVFRRAGYVQQHYWKGDTYPIFQDDREEMNERIFII